MVLCYYKTATLSQCSSERLSTKGAQQGPEHAHLVHSVKYIAMHIVCCGITIYKIHHQLFHFAVLNCFQIYKLGASLSRNSNQIYFINNST